MKFNKISKCRSCNSKKLKFFFNFGLMELSTYFPEKNSSKKESVPLEVIYCQICKLFQLNHNYELKKLFNNDYGYRSGINKSMKAHFQTIINDIQKKIKLKKNDIFLDIASNDGTLLSMIKKNGLKKIGIDPTIRKYKKFYKKDIKTSAKFFSSKNYLSLDKNKVKLITSIAVFYDVHNPNLFIKDVSNIIRKDGIWILEQSYLPSIIKNLAFDSICHEHVTYFTLKQLNIILSNNNLRVIDCTLNEMNGGSIRFFIASKESYLKVNKDNINKIKNIESIFYKNLKKKMDKFKQKILDNKIQLLTILKKLKAKNKKIHVYGASTKGNVLLQYFNINKSYIDFISDRNPRKNNHYTPGTKIKIISESKSRKLLPDYYFVLPWHFKHEILKRENKIRKKGCKFIFPLPKLKVY